MKVRVTVSLDYEVYELIRELSEEADRSVSSFINLMLRRALFKK